MTSFAPLRSRFSNLTAPITGGLSLLVGALVLVGWTADNPTLKSFIPGFVSMKPNAALGLALLGIALFGFSLQQPFAFSRWLAI